MLLLPFCIFAWPASGFTRPFWRRVCSLGYRVDPMERPLRFEHFRYLGDKRVQVVYDVDALDERDSHIIEELLDAETFACFAPDTAAEARNRGYTLWRGHRARSTS